jgi:hypothetical protein
MCGGCAARRLTRVMGVWRQAPGHRVPMMRSQDTKEVVCRDKGRVRVPGLDLTDQCDTSMQTSLSIPTFVAWRPRGNNWPGTAIARPSA